MTQMDKDIEKVLFSEEEIRQNIERLGAEISRDYEGKNLLLICILKGSLVMTADLMKNITIPCRLDTIVASSYDKNHSTGAIKVSKDLDHDMLSDFDVLLVEDIIDSGFTLNHLKDHLAQRSPRSLKILTLLDKPSGRAEGITLKPDYTGMVFSGGFVVGYGLDYDQYYRNLPYIGILKESVYSGK